jgi:predicted acylesterase/phospholipase RssA
MRGSWFAAPLLFAALRLSPVSAAENGPDQCDDGQHLQVTLGLPSEYLKEVPGYGQEPSMVKRDKTRMQACGVIAQGTTYQLLSWLENGALQAAVLNSFAVDVMKADDADRFNREYLQLSTQALSTLPRFERRVVLEDSEGNPVEHPEARLVEFFGALRTGRKPTILMPSHLSPAVRYLVRRAAIWVEGQPIDDEQRDQFFDTLIRSMRFGAPADLVASGQPAPTWELTDIATLKSGDTRAEERPVNQLSVTAGDFVVVRKRVLLASSLMRRLIIDAIGEQAEEKPARPVALFADTPELESKLGEKLLAFRDSNYRRLQFGTILQRNFRFTIPELWTQFGKYDDANQSGNSPFALVLTGGGVKAAYQTHMIDYLYDNLRLSNAGSAQTAQPSTQRVNYVIGTSGGALLGLFVAGMDDEFNNERKRTPLNSLTALLWKNPGEGINSGDVFPGWDMLRYATLVAALVVMLFVSWFMLGFFGSKYRHVRHFDGSEHDFFKHRKRGLKEGWPWILLMVAAPFVIIGAASRNRVEHMPVITGLYYAVMSLIPIYSDVRLEPKGPFTWRWGSWKAAAAAACGILLILLAYWPPGWLQSIEAFKPHHHGLIHMAGLGFLVLALALHQYLADRDDVFVQQPNRPILEAFLVVIGIIAVSYVGVTVAMWLEAASLLELNGPFWLYFLGLVAILTAALMWLGRAPDKHKADSWAQTTVCYLFSEYESRALFGSQRRFMRLVGLSASAWLFWNLLAAPALYGNGNALAYLERTFTRYVERAQPNGAKRTDETEFKLAVPFVITATSLEKSQERYFLFISGDDDVVDAALQPDAWLRVVKDPRWVVVRQPRDGELRDAAFASGSPFPVFSAHEVSLRALRAKEALIDGGFAHNRPLEAASALGARKVLVINSSPIESGGVDACLFGELTCNLPKLVPYLWERSQVEDLLSTRNMFVASIYPTGANGSWPALTDFRKEVVDSLVISARDDREERVGVIESWGAPIFRRIGLFQFDRDLIVTEVKNASG